MHSVKVIPISVIPDYTIITTRSKTIYTIIITLIFVVVVSLPFVKTTISTRATGVTRPMDERTNVKAIQTGIIDTIYYTEGQPVPKDAVILRIKDFTSSNKIQFNTTEANRRAQFIQDIHILNNAVTITDGTTAQLQTPLYKAQLNSFLNRQAEQQAALSKARKEYEMAERLKNDNVISEKEFFDAENAFQRASASYQSFAREQKSRWLQELAQYQSEANQYMQQQRQVQADARFYTVKAPVAGTVQGINTIYTGGILQAGENICTISPESGLVAECYVNTRDVGLLKPGQEARFQVDAFDYNYFGILTGKIVSIDNDFTIVENQPVFKVRCSFDSKQLHLKNGFSGELKKGLTLQARFVVAERTLWQLLFDKIDDWLNPSAPTKPDEKRNKN